MIIEKACWKYIITLLLAACCFSSNVFAQIKQKKKSTLVIKIEHLVGNQELKLDSVNFTNNLGQQFTITKFKYYLSDICLTNKNGVDYITNQVFLIDEEDSSSKTIELTGVPIDDYTAIRFIIGVDSLRNCSGIQSGDLDPINGMFWTWNTGYIFFKLEGRSPLSTAPDGLLEYHIGGFREPVNSIRSVSLPFRSALNMNSKEKQKLAIEVDILQLFKAPYDIDFKSIPIVTGIENAVMISENYMDMFKLK